MVEEPLLGVCAGNIRNSRFPANHLTVRKEVQVAGSVLKGARTAHGKDANRFVLR